MAQCEPFFGSIFFRFHFCAASQNSELSLFPSLLVLAEVNVIFFPVDRMELCFGFVLDTGGIIQRFLLIIFVVIAKQSLHRAKTISGFHSATLAEIGGEWEIGRGHRTGDPHRAMDLRRRMERNSLWRENEKFGAAWRKEVCVETPQHFQGLEGLQRTWRVQLEMMFLHTL